MRITVRCLPSDLDDRLKAVTCLSFLRRSRVVCAHVWEDNTKYFRETIQIHLRRKSKQKRIEIRIV